MHWDIRNTNRNYPALEKIMFRSVNFKKGFNCIDSKILFITIIALSLYTQSCGLKEKFKKKGVIVNVTILDRISPMKGGVYCSYLCEFFYKGELITLISSSSIRYRQKSFIRRTFPALYLEENDALQILMKPEDFNNFGIPFPDSLLFRVIDIEE